MTITPTSSHEIPPAEESALKTKVFKRHGFWSSFGFAFCGIGWVITSQRNMWVHLLIAGLVIALGCMCQVERWEWVSLFIMIGFVLSFEVLNSAIEATVDLVSPEYHLQAKRAKDAGAGAVLIASICAAIVGLIVFVPHLQQLLYHK
jgi:diacylglycerol kinase